MEIDKDVFDNLMQGFYTCYWCGGVEDIHHIGAHVDNCLKEVHWLNKHVALEDDGRLSTQ